MSDRETHEACGGTAPKRRRGTRARLMAGCVLLAAYTPYRVEGDSMAPTLRGRRRGSAGDIVLVNRLAYAISKPSRWDVAVVERRERDSGNESHRSVKRIVGLPGEEFEISGGRCWVGGKPLEPPPSIAGVRVVSKGAFGRGRIRLGDDEYFVLGDESYLSLDSRAWGPVRRADLRGRVDWIVFPFSRAGRVR